MLLPELAADVARVVLVEGESDRLAVERLAQRLGVDLSAKATIVVAMGGVTNIGHYVEAYGPAGSRIELSGLCDLGEVRHVERALHQAGLTMSGFEICDEDLEDELVRAIGFDGMQAFIEAQGEIDAFRSLQKQPAQRARSLGDQLHRFFGTKGGRKVRYAPRLIDSLPIERVPDPLARLVDHIVS